MSGQKKGRLKLNFQDMTIDALKEQYTLNKASLDNHYEMHESMPNIDFSEGIKKIGYKISLILAHVRKIEPDFARTSHTISKADQQELQKLRSILKAKNAQIMEMNKFKVELAHLKSSGDHPTTRMKKLERHTALMSKFKELVMLKLGEEYTKELMNVASGLLED